MPSSAMRHPRCTAAQFRLLVGFILAGLTAAGAAATDGCRAFPGSRDWPSGHVWASLNDKLGGRLLSPSPPAAACHTGQPSYVAAVCPGVQRSWAQSAWHAADPVSVMWDQFTNYSCLPDPRTPCSGQGYPPYVVDASTAEHVKIGIDFAREHNIRVVVKSSGHDYMGRSIAPGALSIWTRHLNGVKFHPGSFRLGGSARVIKGSSMTVGGGVSTYEAYKAADKHHQTIVGGNDGSVSFGGYITGGGHSYTAPHYGLAADNVLELEVVTPTGRILTVNEDRHPDLFWALRGGGGSTFGVITKITMSTHPGVKVVHVDWMIVADGKAKFLWDMISYVISTLPYLLDPGLSGASSINSSFPNPSAAPGLPSRVGGVVGRNIMLGVDDAKEVKRIFRPINETLNQRWPGAVSLIVKTKEHPSFLDWYEGHLNSSDAGYGQYLASRLLDRAALTGDSAALRGALKAGDKPHGQRGFLAVAGKGVQEATPRGGNAVNPAWRKAYVHAVAAARFPPLNKEAERLAVKVLDRSLQPLRNVTPGSGAYIKYQRGTPV